MTFNVYVQGELLPGVSPEQARARVGQLFRLQGERLEALFSGRRVLVRKEVDATVAQKLKAALEQAGLCCQVQAVAPSEQVPSSVPIGRQAVAPVAESPVTADLQRVGTIRVAGTGFVGPFQVGAPGEDLAPRRPSMPVPEPDLGHLSLAPAGSDLGEQRSEPPPPAPDTSHLSLLP